jgi:Zn-dependent M16 (insulinase) family peptidase
LGEDLTSSGYSSGSLESTFHVGLKGTEPERKQAIVDLVLDTLRTVAAEGVSRERVETAFHQLQYAHREIQSAYPLHLMERVYSAWNFDLDPLTYLPIGQHLDALHDEYRREPGLFAGILREKLVDNPHRLTGVFRPDPDLLDRRQREFEQEMRALRSGMSPARLDQVRTDAAELEKRQARPNTAAELATLPRLKIADLPAVPSAIPSHVIPVGESVLLLRNDVFANGVNYLMLAFDLTGLPEELCPYVPVFAHVFSRVGAAGESYVDIAERVAANTGGLHAATFVGSHARDPERLLAYFTVSLKTLDATHATALSIVRKLLFDLDLEDRDRLRDVLVQRKVRLHSSVIPNGHRFAALHAARDLSPVGALSEVWAGLPQLRLGDQLASGFPDHVDDLCGKLQRIRRFLLDAARIKASFTGSDDQLGETREWLGGLAVAAQAPPEGPPAASDSPSSLGGGGLAEGLVAAADVAYCVRCMPAPPMSDPRSPLLQIFSHLLNYDFMWEEIRVKGGAYGGMSTYDVNSRVFELMSYRDPGVERTLRTYEKVLDHVRGIEWSGRDIEQAVIGCAKGDERPIRPGWATATALWRCIGGLGEDLRRDRRDALLRATPDAVKATAVSLLTDYGERSNTCVLSSRQKLEEANRALTQPLQLEEVFSGAPAGGEPGQAESAV